MNTKFIGIKEFRQNISKYAKEAQKKHERLVLMNRNKPVFELRPFAEDAELGNILEEIMQAKKDVDTGDVYTHDEVLKELE